MPVLILKGGNKRKDRAVIAELAEGFGSGSTGLVTSPPECTDEGVR